MRPNKGRPKPAKGKRSLAHLSARWNVEKAPLAGRGPPRNGWLWRARTGLSEWYVRRRVAAAIAAILLALLLAAVFFVLRYSSSFFEWIAAQRDRAGP
jgi:hypothetical protein